MKKLLTLSLALVALIAFSGLGVAQQKGVEKSRPTGVEKKQPAPGEKNFLDTNVPVIKPAINAFKATQINEKDKTFTGMSKGNAFTFNAAKLKALPKVGEVIDITYTETPGGRTMEATTINTSKSNTY